jgi:hypothetical protein
MSPALKQLRLLCFYHSEKEGLAMQHKFFEELNADIKNFCEFRANNIFHCIEQHEQYVGRSHPDPPLYFCNILRMFNNSLQFLIQRSEICGEESQRATGLDKLRLLKEASELKVR